MGRRTITSTPYHTFDNYLIKIWAGSKAGLRCQSACLDRSKGEATSATYATTKNLFFVCIELTSENTNYWLSSLSRILIFFSLPKNPHNLLLLACWACMYSVMHVVHLPTIQTKRLTLHHTATHYVATFLTVLSIWAAAGTPWYIVDFRSCVTIYRSSICTTLQSPAT